MRRFACLAVAALWSAVVVPAAFAYPERVEEIWRSPYGAALGPTQPGVDQRDGSLWSVEGAVVTHRSREGDLLGRSPALCNPYALAANPADGSCWVWAYGSGEVVHLASNGTILSTTPDFPTDPHVYAVYQLIVNPFDGSVWVVGGTMQEFEIIPCSLTHISATGEKLSEEEGPRQVVVDPADGTTWTCSDQETVRRNADGSEVWRVPYPGVVADADPRDQSLWVANSASGSSSTVTHLSAGGEALWQSAEPATTGNYPYEVHVSHADGSVWIHYSYAPWWNPTDQPDPSPRWLHLGSAGAQIAEPDFDLILFNDLDGSVWAGPCDGFTGQLAQYSSSGQLLSPSITIIAWATYDQANNAFWMVYMPSLVGAAGGNELQRIAADGTVLWHEPMLLLELAQRTPDPEDGSVWALSGANELIRFAPTGREVERRDVPAGLDVDFWYGLSLTISPYDGTWWISDRGTLTHLSADGIILSQVGGTGADPPVISPADGSLWLTWYQHIVYIEGETTAGKSYSVWQGHVLHLGADGALLWTKEYTCHVAGLALDEDGSAWVVADYPEGTKLEHLSATGDVLGTPVPAPLAAAYGIARSQADGSFYASGWGSDPEEDMFPEEGTADGWVARVAADGSLLWKHEGLLHPLNIALNPADGSVWVADLGDVDHPYSAGSAVAHFAADGTELWRSAAFSRPGELALDRRDGSVWVSDVGNAQVVHLRGLMPPFPDIPTDFWAFDAVAACAAAGIVQGYEDGYHPDQLVTRDQMAVYISRALAGGDDVVAVPTGVAEPTFTDVGEDFWAYRYIEYCAGANIVQGYDDGGYHPDEVVNRGQMAVYIARALVTPSGDAGIPDYAHMLIEPPVWFTDVTTANEWAWCYNHVIYCAAQGVVQGYPVPPGRPEGPLYVPGNAVTRDQMAVYIARAFALVL